MSKCFFALFWTALTMQAAPISGLPTISVTNATGQAFWGNESASANLAGSLFTLNFSAIYPQQPPIPFYFDVMPGSVLASDVGNQWDLDSSIDNTEVSPDGTVVINGVNTFITYGGGLVVEALGTTIVPSDVETVSLPAVLRGDVPICMPASAPNCNPFMQPPSLVFLANIDFDVPGTLTVSFTPLSTGPLLENEDFTVTFAPAPEPRGLIATPAALLLIGLLKRALSVSCAARKST